MSAPRDPPARQPGSTGAIARSYDLLTEAEQRLFRCLSVFVGGFTLDAVEAVYQDTGTGSDGATLGGDHSHEVSSLVDTGLVQAGESPNGEWRFTIAETIRAHGLQRLGAAGEAATVRRSHLDWCAALAERGQPGIFGPDGARWLDTFERELDNFRAALAWSVTDPTASSAQAGLRLAGALQQLWFYGCHLHEGQRWLEQTLLADRERSVADSRIGTCPEVGRGGTASGVSAARTGAFGVHARVLALNGLSTLLLTRGATEQAASTAEEALACARDVGDRLGEAHALMTLGNIARESGASERSIPVLEEALAIVRGLDDPFGIWRALSNLGTALSRNGDGERAQDMIKQSLTIVRALGDAWGTAQTLRLLGGIAFWRGDLVRATALLDESLTWWVRAHSTRGRHRSLYERGQVALATGDARQAVASFFESLLVCHEIGDPFLVAPCLEGLAAAAAAGSSESTSWLTVVPCLLGAADAVREAPGVTVPPPITTTVEQAVAASRAGLGEHGHTSARVVGRNLPLDRAIEYARGLANESPLAGSTLAPRSSQSAEHGDVS